MTEIMIKGKNNNAGLTVILKPVIVTNNENVQNTPKHELLCIIFICTALVRKYVWITKQFSIKVGDSY